MNHYSGYLQHILNIRKISERELAQKSGVSRGTLRSILKGGSNYRLNSLTRLLAVLDLRADVIMHGDEGSVDCSTIAISIKISQDGFESWKLHLMNFVDEFRRTKDIRLALLPPCRSLDNRLRALLASTTVALCTEIGIEAPPWANRTIFLSTPWFVSESEALKATAISESPLVYRRNNIFVHNNFLSRI